MLEYNYPILSDWTTDELLVVVSFYEAIEKAYETGVDKQYLLQVYNNFKKVVPSKAEEKTLLKEFETVSSYVAFNVLKEAKTNDDNMKIKMPQR